MAPPGATGGRPSLCTYIWMSDEGLGMFKLLEMLDCRNLRLHRLDYTYNIVVRLHILYSAGISKQSKGARNRVGIGLSYRLARLHRLAELIPWNRFLAQMFKNPGL